ncbi:MAG: hypothetical protein IPJ65_42205 [Archangiaceae bacterium]|nr:hypothetical protein [Archangiaceae bacterium]
MNHEAAHLWVYELIGQTRKPELFKTFGEARAADGFGVTRYEQSTLHEQIAEELTARVVVRECDNAAMDEAHRKLWPNLTMVIDKL